MLATVRAIPMTREMRLDYERVALVYEQLSDPETEDRVFRAVTTLELQIEAIVLAQAAGCLADVARVANATVPVAEELGLLSVEAAARGVAVSAGRRDVAATAACVARLERTGEGSLGALTNPDTSSA